MQYVAYITVVEDIPLMVAFRVNMDSTDNGSVG